MTTTNGTTNTAANTAEEIVEDGNYDARCIGFAMSDTKGGNDQLLIDLEIHVGEKWIKRTKYNNLSTDIGFEIAVADGIALGNTSDNMMTWKPDPALIVTIVLKSEQYEGKWRQHVKNIYGKRREYPAVQFQQKALSMVDRMAAARVRHAEYLQKKAEGQMGGRGRSNELPQSGSERDDFGRGKNDDFAGSDGTERF